MDSASRKCIGRQLLCVQCESHWPNFLNGLLFLGISLDAVQALLPMATDHIEGLPEFPNFKALRLK